MTENFSVFDNPYCGEFYNSETFQTYGDGIDEGEKLEREDRKKYINSLYIPDYNKDTDLSDMIWNVHALTNETGTPIESGVLDQLKLTEEKNVPKTCTVLGISTYKKLFEGKFSNVNILVEKNFDSAKLHFLVEQKINFVLILRTSLTKFFANLGYAAAREITDVTLKCLSSEKIYDLSINDYTNIKLAKSHRINFNLVK